ncbi:hypothetical protein LJR129_005013 [Acidovorax sp. LjRoot129]|uniref:hypothetical protein n=1 Tax=unclassified Acidovorax TaxID=2684926 RepID=UPI003ECE4610
MSVLAVLTKEQEDGSFLTKWSWKQQATARPLVGTIRVTVDSAHREDRDALAELQALYHLLEVRNVQGSNRMGNGITVEVTAGSIRKALLKGSLKVSGTGKTVKPHVAQCATFLATKYFEASFEVGRWRDEEPRAVEDEVSVHLGPQFPKIHLRCDFLGDEVFVSRHAMNRYVGRISEGLDRYAENDLSKLPDSRWTAAWVWFTNVLQHKDLRTADLLPEKQQQFLSKYGSKCSYLLFQDAGAVLVLRKAPIGYDTLTVLRVSPYTPILVEQRYVVGQKIVSARNHRPSRQRSNGEGK